jgi:hypothetical protein
MDAEMLIWILYILLEDEGYNLNVFPISKNGTFSPFWG